MPATGRPRAGSFCVSALGGNELCERGWSSRTALGLPASQGEPDVTLGENQRGCAFPLPQHPSFLHKPAACAVTLLLYHDGVETPPVKGTARSDTTEGLNLNPGLRAPHGSLL